MSKTKHLTRGSSADRELNCAGAIGHDGPTYNTHSDEARLGTAVHAALADMVLGIEPNLEQMARTHGVYDKGLRIAYHQGVKIWREIGPSIIGDRNVEVRISGHTTCGHLDLLVIDKSAGKAHILDWKLGMSDDEHQPQLMAYGLALMDRFEDEPVSGDDDDECAIDADCTITAIEVWLMRGEYRVHEFTRHQLGAFRARLEGQHAQAGKQFAAGSWCKYCPIRIQCDVRDQYLRSAAAALTETGSRKISRKELASLWQRSRMVKKAIEEYEKAVKGELRGGPIDTDDGKVLELCESHRSTFEPGPVIALLEDELNIASMVSVSKAGLERAIGEVAPPRQKARMLSETMERLERAGAVTLKPTYRVREKTK